MELRDNTTMNRRWSTPRICTLHKIPHCTVDRDVHYSDVSFDLQTWHFHPPFVWSKALLHHAANPPSQARSPTFFSLHAYIVNHVQPNKMYVDF
nr:hypothetical protein Iba_chr02eCG3540 [Ipomoea batatas]